MKQHSTTSNKPCPEWLEKLNAYHPDDLSPEEWAQLNKHLATCAQCRAAKAEYATINARILGLPRARRVCFIFLHEGGGRIEGKRRRGTRE
jgi:hypothetical protein